MSGRPYRVAKGFRWIEGGRPAPGPQWWEGGEVVVYEPGDTVSMEDQDVESMYRYLEALDEAGRAVLEEARARAKGPAKITPVADFTPSDVEFLTRAFEEKRRAYGCVGEYAVNRDGSETLLRYIPTNPLPGVVHGDNGLPDPWATALQRERREKEREHRETENKIARILGGGSRGRQRARETKRDAAASGNAALLADVQAYRAKHQNHGRPAIAEALVDMHGNIRDHADPRSREKAIEALRKRIERLEKAQKSLDT